MGFNDPSRRPPSRLNRPGNQVPLAGLPDARAAANDAQVDLLVAYLLRHPTLFLEVRRELLPEHFSQQGEWAFGVMWQVFNDLYDRYGRHPEQAQLLAELKAALVDAVRDVPPESALRVELAIRAAYLMDVHVLVDSEQYGRDLVHDFLVERAVFRHLANQIDNVRGAQAGPADLGGLIDSARSVLVRIEGLRSNPVSPLLPQGWKLTQAPLVPTGLTFVDEVIQGTEAGKVYGIFGVTGAFKTGLAVQMFVARSHYEMSTNPTDPGMCVYFTWEGGGDEIRERALATGAQMPKDRVVSYLLGQKALSTRDNLEPYEKQRQAARKSDAPPLMSESERYARAVDMGQAIQIGDMQLEGAGDGYVDEIVAHLDRLRRQTGRRVAVVFIDYAKRMVDRYMAARRIPREHIRHYLSPLPDLLRRDVAAKFKCPVWVLQQLNTEANKKAAGAAQHHSFSSESGDFAENLWNCICLSAIDAAQNHTTQMTFTKVRDWAKPPTGTVLRLDGTRNALVPTNKYVIDPATRRIVERAVAGAMHRDGGRPANTADADAADAETSPAATQPDATQPDAAQPGATTAASARKPAKKVGRVAPLRPDEDVPEAAEAAEAAEASDTPPGPEAAGGETTEGG